MAPVSIRTTELDQQGNEVAAMFVPIGTHIADAIDRLAAIHEETSTQKVMLQAIDARQLTAYSQYLPGALVGASQRLNAELGAQNTAQPVYNTVLTNLPGSQVPLYFHGSKLVELWGFGIPTLNAGLFHAAQSYSGTVYLGMISDPEDGPGPRVLLRVPPGVVRRPHARHRSGIEGDDCTICVRVRRQQAPRRSAPRRSRPRSAATKKPAAKKPRDEARHRQPGAASSTA